MSNAPSRWLAPAVTTGHGQLEGRVGLVTGAGRNIGAAIARRLAAEGMAVAVGDIDIRSAEQVVRAIRDAGGTAVAAVGDLADVDAVDQLFDEIERELGPVDALVNNAYARVGATCFAPFLKVAVEDWQAFVAANTTMFFAPAQRMARRLASLGAPGSIVNISSHGAARAHREHIPYDSVKGAMESFTRAVAVDLAPWGIRCNCVRPGAVAVEDEKLDWGEEGDLRSAQIPLGRPASPSDVAASVLYLTSAESSYVTGQIFNVDGGMAVQARAPQVEPQPPATPGTLTDVPSRLRG
ncbi:SDR family NAD(P)-dependent oxidoreductase [Saccharopolyspora hattusasensis]|uniref:SDR family NAD(P)-dependent oxidoreductase n=1 Tax=Saccharopolyspora hattusasensis TaxID=1128679 RepID=UPI003D99B2B4